MIAFFFTSSTCSKTFSVLIVIFCTSIEVKNQPLFPDRFFIVMQGRHFLGLSGPAEKISDHFRPNLITVIGQVDAIFKKTCFVGSIHPANKGIENI